MKSAVAPMSVATATKTSAKTYLGIGMIGAASFAAAMFMAAAQPGSLGLDVTKAATTQAAVEGEVGVPSLGFLITAHKQDVQVNSLSFALAAEADGDFASIEGGLDIHDYIQSCSLYEQGVVAPLSTQPLTAAPATDITFSGLGLVINKNTAPHFEVTCDYANVAVPHTNAYAFALSLPSDTFVDAEEVVSGNALPADRVMAGPTDGGLNMAAGDVVKLYDHGTVDIHTSAETPSSDILVQGDFNDKIDGPAVGKWVIIPHGEDVALNTLTFSTPTDYSRDINTATVEILNNGTLTKDIIPVFGQSIQFTNLGVNLTQDTETTVTLDIHTRPAVTMPGGSGVSGDVLSFNLEAQTDTDFSATGLVSGTTIDGTDVGLLVGAKSSFVYRYTQPTISLSAASPSGAAVVGTVEALRYNVTADLMGEVKVRDFIFDFTATDIASSGWDSCDTTLPVSLTAADFSLYDLSGAGLAASLDTSNADWTLYDLSGNPCGPGSGTLGFAKLTLPTALSIPPLTNHALSLYVDATGASTVQHDSLRIDIRGTIKPDNIIQNNGLDWDDGSGKTINGAFINALPMSGGTLTF